MSGQAFQFVPGMGAVPLEPSVPAGGVIGAGEAIAALRQQVDEQEREREEQARSRNVKGLAAAKALLAPTLSGRSLVRQIRDRLRAVRTELKALRRLELEEAELKRLLAAAKTPPAPVTHITSARKSG